MKTTRNIIIITIFLLTTAFSAFGTDGDNQQSRGIKMSHKLKGETLGLDCVFCHQINEEEPRFVSFPGHDNCGMCHFMEVSSENEEDCGFCHTSPTRETSIRRGVTLSPLVMFDHQVHADREISCSACHPIPESSVIRGNEMLPLMDSCVSCHEERGVSREEECLSCHFEEYEYIEPLSHDDSWFGIHGHASKEAREDYNCASCHTEAFDNSCLSCHHQNRLVGKEADCSRCHSTELQNIPPPDHTPLWRESHGWGLEESVVESECGICHRASFGNDCVSCHQSETPQSHTLGFRIRSHAQQAYIDRESCATCHNQSECITCHTTNPPISHTGLWGSPYYRHCAFCHMEGNDYGAGGIEGNCIACHDSTIIYASHTSMSGHTTSTCSNCHDLGGTNGPDHPVPATQQSCESCHAF